MVLFSFAIYRATLSIAARTRLNNRLSLTTILINENIFYFCVVSWVLIFNNLMVIVSVYFIQFNIQIDFVIRVQRVKLTSRGSDLGLHFNELQIHRIYSD